LTFTLAGKADDHVSHGRDAANLNFGNCFAYAVQSSCGCRVSFSPLDAYAQNAPMRSSGHFLAVICTLPAIESEQCHCWRRRDTGHFVRGIARQAACKKNKGKFRFGAPGRKSMGPPCATPRASFENAKK
jgi:hypothetical protein